MAIRNFLYRSDLVFLSLLVISYLSSIIYLLSSPYCLLLTPYYLLYTVYCPVRHSDFIPRHFYTYLLSFFALLPTPYAVFLFSVLCCLSSPYCLLLTPYYLSTISTLPLYCFRRNRMFHLLDYFLL